MDYRASFFMFLGELPGEVLMIIVFARFGAGLRWPGNLLESRVGQQKGGGRRTRIDAIPTCPTKTRVAPATLKLYTNYRSCLLISTSSLSAKKKSCQLENFSRANPRRILQLSSHTRASPSSPPSTPSHLPGRDQTWASGEEVPTSMRPKRQWQQVHHEHLSRHKISHLSSSLGHA